MALPAYAVDQDAVLKNVSSNVKWRNGIPNYAKPKALFDAHKTTNHKAGSLEEIVQNLVKNWEKEVSHKTDPRQWDTVDLDNYYFSCNGLRKNTGYEMLQKGTYNALIGDTPYYNSSTTGFEESHEAFRKTLGDGFAWEVLEVFSGPPTVTFSWRHFGKMTNPFLSKGIAGFPYKAEPTNRMVEIYGMCKATDPNQLFVQLTANCPFAPFANAPGNSKSVQSEPPAEPKPPVQPQPPPPSQPPLSSQRPPSSQPPQSFQPPPQFQPSVAPDEYYHYQHNRHHRHGSSGKDSSHRRH